MAFTTPCFVRVEDAEKRKKLVKWLWEIGHDVCACCLFDGWNTVHCNPLLHDSTFDVHGVPDYDAESGYNIELFKHQNSLKERPAYDCGTNVALFRALAAMSDEEWGEQVYIHESDKSGPHIDEKTGLPHNTGRLRKATAEEIIEYFKKREE